MTGDNRSEILLESGTNELEILVFSLEGQRYGVNVAKVREVIEPLAVTRLPHSHHAVVGMFQLRHTVTPLVDLRRALNKTPIEPGEGKIVIMEFNEARVGFLVDAVEQIYRVGWKEVSAVPDVGGVCETPLTSIAHIQGDMVLMIDFERLVFEIGGVDLFEQASRQLRPAEQRGERRILLAEDSHLMRKLIGDNLHKAGYTNVTICQDGQEAWEYLEAGLATDGTSPVDLMITDIEMPRIDGLHLTRRVKQHDRLAHLPVVIFSSLVSPDNEKKCASVGADAQITKPQLAELVDLLDGLLAESPSPADAVAVG